MPYNYIKVIKESSEVCTLMLNNLKVKNALNIEMIKEITNAIKSLKKNKFLRILKITGGEDTFSAGADLEWMKSSKNLTKKENKIDALIFAKMLKEIHEFPLPTISLVNGHAYGGGIGIIAASDFSISLESSNFCFSEVRLGIIPAMIAPYVLERTNHISAKQLFLTGEVFNARKAFEIKLVDYVENNKSYIKKINKLIEKLLLGGPNAQKSIKTFTRELKKNKLNKNITEKTADFIAKIRVSKEAQEGIGAFLEKRSPKW